MTKITNCTRRKVAKHPKVIGRRSGDSIDIENFDDLQTDVLDCWRKLANRRDRIEADESDWYDLEGGDPLSKAYVSLMNRLDSVLTELESVIEAHGALLHVVNETEREEADNG